MALFKLGCDVGEVEGAAVVDVEGDLRHQLAGRVVRQLGEVDHRVMAFEILAGEDEDGLYQGERLATAVAVEEAGAVESGVDSGDVVDNHSISILAAVVPSEARRRGWGLGRCELAHGARLLPRRKGSATVKKLIPRRGIGSCIEKSPPPAGGRLAGLENANPPRGIDILTEILRIGRRGHEIFLGNVPFPRGGLAFCAQIGRRPAGEHNFSRQITVPPRGDGIFRVEPSFPAGAKGSS